MDFKAILQKLDQINAPSNKQQLSESTKQSEWFPPAKDGKDVEDDAPSKSSRSKVASKKSTSYTDSSGKKHGATIVTGKSYGHAGGKSEVDRENERMRKNTSANRSDESVSKFGDKFLKMVESQTELNSAKQEKTLKAQAAQIEKLKNQIAKLKETSVNEAVRVMGKTDTSSGMTRYAKGHSEEGQRHRDETAKMVKQARADGKTLRKDSTVNVSEPNKYGQADKQVMKYDSKDVKKESRRVSGKRINESNGDIDAQATMKFANMLASKIKSQFNVSAKISQDSNGYATILVNDGYLSSEKEGNSNSSVVSPQNLSKVLDTYFYGARQNGDYFDQPVGGKFSVGIKHGSKGQYESRRVSGKRINESYHYTGRKLSFKEMIKLVQESGGQQRIDPVDSNLFNWATRIAVNKLGEGTRAEVYAGMVYERMGGTFEMYDMLSESGHFENDDDTYLDPVTLKTHYSDMSFPEYEERDERVDYYLDELLASPEFHKAVKISARNFENDDSKDSEESFFSQVVNSNANAGAYRVNAYIDGLAESNSEDNVYAAFMQEVAKALGLPSDEDTVMNASVGEMSSRTMGESIDDDEFDLDYDWLSNDRDSDFDQPISSGNHDDVDNVEAIVNDFDNKIISYKSFCNQLSNIAGRDMSPLCLEYATEEIGVDELLNACVIDNTIDVDKLNPERDLSSMPSVRTESIQKKKYN